MEKGLYKQSILMRENLYGKRFVQAVYIQEYVQLFLQMKDMIHDLISQFNEPAHGI